MLKIIEGSAKNIIQVLKYYISRGKNELEIILDKINAYLMQVNVNMTIEEMMAMEGNIRRHITEGLILF